MATLPLSSTIPVAISLTLRHRRGTVDVIQTHGDSTLAGDARGDKGICWATTLILATAATPSVFRVANVANTNRTGSGRFSSVKGKQRQGAAPVPTSGPSSGGTKIIGLNQGFCMRLAWHFKYLQALAAKPCVLAGDTSNTLSVAYLINLCPPKTSRKRNAEAGQRKLMNPYPLFFFVLKSVGK
eukprot:CAMPEP_0115413016 /NCGR_PEP_ID=MMETSP0271-20121206/21854_1 /TAXON_ID=71861 /ORGANISM="Scrippsiella trochoidea, Strain CCMP3099" /LENGTH=183 /DNA_ID=CAMNT_0002837285 /DNA_START=471 /DNA_END=1023 /DNA_ORIENTATION=-